MINAFKKAIYGRFNNITIKYIQTTELYNNYIIVTGMEGNISIDRLPKGRGTDQWKSFHWSVPRPKDSLSILILHSISVTIVCIALKTRI